jgi:hypothetical protein
MPMGASTVSYSLTLIFCTLCFVFSVHYLCFLYYMHMYIKCFCCIICTCILSLQIVFNVGFIWI